MKKCPFCGEKLEDEAVFCLYCMTELEEKRIIENPAEKHSFKHIIIAVCGAFLFILTAVIIIALNSDKITPSTENSSLSDNTVASTVSFDEQIPHTPSGEQAGFSDGKTDETYNNSSVVNSAKDSSSQSSKSSQSDKSDTVSSKTNSSKIQSSDSTVLTSSLTSITSSVSSSDNNTFTDLKDYCQYRNAKSSDDFSTGYPYEGKIVITKITVAAKNGVYSIPSEIEGKPVMAIMPLAFYEGGIASSVKKVIVPESIKTIHDNVFAGCSNLTDVYYKGNSIYTYPDAFKGCPDNIVLHCSADCNDRNFRYYKNSASDYGLTYKEWNGVIDF